MALSKGKKVGLVLMLSVGIFFIYVGMQPSAYLISREVVIDAPVEKVFPYLNNPELGEKWGPWMEVDPQMKMARSGPSEGVGAKSSWESAGRMGTGSATITESIPNQKVVIALEYTKPMEMKQTATYLLESAGEGRSKATWQVEGHNHFVGRIMCCFMNMDKMVGEMFSKGLGNLKKLVEASK